MGKGGFSSSSLFHESSAYGDEEIWLSLIEVDPHNLANGLRSIDQRPDVLVVFTELNHPLPRHQQSRGRRKRIHNDDDLGPLSKLCESHVLGGRLNLPEACLESPEHPFQSVRGTDGNRLQLKMWMDFRDETCRFIDGVVRNAC